MPELPDLVHVERVLRAELAGRRLLEARAADPTVLRVMTPEPFPAGLVGKTLATVERRGHFMRFGFQGEGTDGGGVVVVVNAMLVGRYQLLSASERRKDPAGLGFAWVFEGDRQLWYVDDKRMGKVYLAPAADEERIPIYGELGVEVLSEALDRERFLELARRRRDQVRMFLMDKRTLASIGNAYADEILFAARIHPKTFVRQLGAEDLDRLYLAIGQVLRDAVAEIERRNEPIEVKVRDFLAVRGREGKPCRVCGNKIRSVRVGDGDACFCPSCQPTTRRLFVDWSRLSSSSPAGPAAAGEPAAAAPVTGSDRAVVPAEDIGSTGGAAVTAVTAARRRKPPAAGGTGPPRPRSRR